MTAAVCVVVPFYNPGIRILAECVASIQLQSFDDWELLLLDDGSTDGSLEWARSLNDARIRVYTDGQNLGLIARLNQMVSLTDSPLIARMDADDACMPNRLAMQFAAIGEGHSVCATGVVSCDDEMAPLGCRNSSHLSANDEKDWIAGRKGIVHASVMARREWFEAHPYDSDAYRIEDLVLFAQSRLSGTLSLVCVDSPLYLYRELSNVVPAKLLSAYASQLKWSSRWRVSFFSRIHIACIALAKIVAVRLLWNLGLRERLLASRGRPLGPHEKPISDAVDKIRKQAATLV